MPKLRSESFGSGDLTWLASDHGMFNCRTLTLDAATFAEIQSTYGKVPSGSPVVVADGKVSPYTGSGDFAGHILFDADAAHGDDSVEVLWTGAVVTERVPGNFSAPAKQTQTTIAYR